MEKIVKYVVECDSAYGVVCVIACLICFYLTIRFVFPWLYKGLCKICSTLVKYKNIHTKIDVEDVSIEAELHQ